MWKTKLRSVLWSLVRLAILGVFFASVLGAHFPWTPWLAANPWFTSLVFGGIGAWVVLGYWKQEQAQDRPSKEFRDRLLHGKPLEVKRVTPKPARYHFYEDKECWRQFSRDFAAFGEIVNSLWGIEETPWRFQQMESMDLHRLAYDSPRAGYQYKIFYNQIQVGSLEITCAGPEYTTDNPKIFANVTLNDGIELIEYDDVAFLTNLIGTFLAGKEDEEDYEDIKRKMQRALLSSLWNGMRSQIMDESPSMEVDVSFGGVAARYIAIKQQKMAETVEGRSR